jgi:hypothetical protein
LATKPAWKTFEQEICTALRGRRVIVSRRGRYADIRTPHLLIEAKWSDQGLRITAPALLKIRELAERHGRYPVLAAGTGHLRAVCLVGEQPRTAPIDNDILRLLEYWHTRGCTVWIAPLSTDWPGHPGVLPTTRLIGIRYAPPPDNASRSTGPRATAGTVASVVAQPSTAHTTTDSEG